MWSEEAKKQTVENFGIFGETCLKCDKPRLFAIGYDKSLYFDDTLEDAIPKKYKDKDIVLFNRDGAGFLNAYDSVYEMVEDGWVID